MLLVIDGIPLDDDIKAKIKIDPNAIKSIKIISQEKIYNSGINHINGDVLVITTK